MGIDSLVSECKAGGIKGCLGLDQIDWGGTAGPCYAVWKCEPCCGSPCNPKDAIYCLVCWHFCAFCSASKLYASSLKQDCAIVPHVLMMWCFGPCAAVCMRYNLRKGSGAKGTICGDMVCMWCFGCCSWLQQLRSVQKSAWDLMPCKVPGIVASPLKVML